MDIGIVGLGRMGGNMARRLSRGGARVVGHDDVTPQLLRDLDAGRVK